MARLIKFAREGNYTEVVNLVERYDKALKRKEARILEIEPQNIVGSNNSRSRHSASSPWGRVRNIMHSGSFVKPPSTPMNSSTPGDTIASSRRDSLVETDDQVQDFDADWLNKKEKESGDTALHAAIRANQTKIALHLLNHSHVNYNLPTSNHFTALHLACINGDAAVIKKLCQFQKLDLNARSQPLGFSAIDWAIYYRHDDIIKDLVSAGADLFSADMLGYFPIQRAVIYCKLDTIIALLGKMEPFLPSGHLEKFLPVDPASMTGMKYFNMSLTEFAAENKDPEVKTFIYCAEQAWREGKLQFFLQNYKNDSHTKNQEILLPIDLNKVNLDENAYARINNTDKFPLSFFILKYYKEATPLKQKTLIESCVLSKVLSVNYELINEQIKKLFERNRISEDRRQEIAGMIAAHLMKAKNEEEVSQDYFQLARINSIEALEKYTHPLAKAALSKEAIEKLRDTDTYPLSKWIILQYKKCSLGRQEELVANRVLTKLLGDDYAKLNQHIHDCFLSHVSNNEARNKILEDIAIYLLKAQSEQDTEYDYLKLMQLNSFEELRKNIKSFSDYQREIMKILFAPKDGLIQGRVVNLAISSARRFLALYQDADAENRNALDHLLHVSLPILLDCKAALLHCTNTFVALLDLHLPLSTETLLKLEGKQVLPGSVVLSEEEEKKYKRMLAHRLKIVTGFVKKIVDYNDKASVLAFLNKINDICKKPENAGELLDTEKGQPIYCSSILKEIEGLVLTPDLQALIDKSSQKHVMVTSPMLEDGKKIKSLPLKKMISPIFSLALPSYMRHTTSSSQRHSPRDGSPLTPPVSPRIRVHSPQMLSPREKRLLKENNELKRRLELFETNNSKTNTKIDALLEKIEFLGSKLDMMNNKIDNNRILIASHGQDPNRYVNGKTKLTAQQKECQHKLGRLEQRLARRLHENEILPGTNSDVYIAKLRQKIANAEFAATLAATFTEQSHSDDKLQDYFTSRLLAYINQAKAYYYDVAGGRREADKSLSQQALEGGITVMSKLAPIGGGVISGVGGGISQLYFSRRSKSKIKKINQFATCKFAIDEINGKLAEHFWDIYKEAFIKNKLTNDDIDNIAAKIAGYLVSKLWAERELEQFKLSSDIHELDDYFRLVIQKVMQYAEKEPFYNKGKLSIKIDGSSAFISSLLAKITFVNENGHLLAHKSRVKKDSKPKYPGKKCHFKYGSVFKEDTFLAKKDIALPKRQEIQKQNELDKFAVTDLFKQRRLQPVAAHFSPAAHLINGK